MQKTCANGWCKASFEITDDDLAFYDKVSPVFGGKKYSIPAPTQCPECRQQKRKSRRNERYLYKRECALTKVPMISNYRPDAPCTVCHHAEWWKDTWDPMSYGREFDFSRPFFEQFAELAKVVPRPSIHVIDNENCEYVNQCGFSKNCYLSYNTDYSENCAYCCNTIRSKDSYDLLNCEHSELSYDSSHLATCNRVIGSRNCKNCSDVWFSRDLIGCSYCFGCSNLRNKKYCFLNEQLSKEEFQKKMNMLSLSSRKTYEAAQKMAEAEHVKHPVRGTETIECDNCTGDYLRNCQNCFECYDCFENQDTKFCTVTSHLKDSYDNDTGGYNSELCYEMISAALNNHHCLFCSQIWGNCWNLLYCEFIVGCQNCFGSLSLRRKEFCILNKQYTKQEYETLMPKILEHMQKTGELGEFFPVNISPFGYNESIAQEFFPLNQKEVNERGWHWNMYEAPPPTVEKTIKAKDLPDVLDDIPDDILNWAILCEETGKPFKIIRQELEYYRQLKLPIPRRHPDQRHKDRLALRNPRKLWDRSCANCKKAMQTTYAPDRPEIVYCEDCYLKEVY